MTGMIISVTIIIVLVGCLLVVAQLQNANQDYSNELNNLNCKNVKLTTDYNEKAKEAVRLTNKIIEINKHAELVENDAAQRIEEFKKHPIIAVMTDGQVQILAEMLAYHLREILDAKKEWVN